MNGRSLIW